jgi:hypothetical protein
MLDATVSEKPMMAPASDSAAAVQPRHFVEGREAHIDGREQADHDQPGQQMLHVQVELIDRQLRHDCASPTFCAFCAHAL